MKEPRKGRTRHRIVPPKRKRRPMPPPGTRPGTLHIPPDAPRPTIDLIVYSPAEIEERRIEELDHLPEISEDRVLWLNVCGYGDLPTLQRLADQFDLHLLALEDVVRAEQRAKVEVYSDWTFIVAFMVDPATTPPALEQISFFVRPQMVITFQELPQDVFEPVRDRLRQQAGRIRSRGSDYLAYALLDALIDGYFPALERYGDQLEELEDRILTDPGEDNLQELHRLRRELIALRRVILPHREAVNVLLRSAVPPFSEETRLFLRDCYDHTIRLIELIESYREFAASLMDVYLSTLGQKTNEVMKILTIISTIFIPLSFLAGLYGMNFDTSHPLNMPELGSPYGYPALLAVMAGVIVVLVLFFRRKGWL